MTNNLRSSNETISEEKSKDVNCAWWLCWFAVLPGVLCVGLVWLMIVLSK